MDSRLTAANGRVAAAHLKGHVHAERYVTGEARTVITPVADLLRAANAGRERQLLLGSAVTVYEDRDGWSFVQSDRDGYVGYVASDLLGPASTPTHHVATPATHLYAAEDIKSPDLMALPFGARLTVTAERQKFWETPLGFVPKKHLWPVSKPFTDPVTVAQLHFGVPYLWGGNSIRGIDCSGLVQASILACGKDCPGDSDMQCDQVGEPLSETAPLLRGDLVFWEGHVGIMVDTDTMIHANAHHMAVAYEPIDAAILRIKAQGDGPVLVRKRV
jgi:cell wall-associated NlpC family hydrolase